MKAKFPAMYSIKIHGHEMQSSSIPDNLFCISGIFVAIEFKIQRDKRISMSPAQMKELNKIKDSKGVALTIAYDENVHKILMIEQRWNYSAIFFSPSNKNVKSKNIKVDWDFEFSTYEDAVDLISVMVENK